MSTDDRTDFQESRFTSAEPGILPLSDSLGAPESIPAPVEPDPVNAVSDGRDPASGRFTVNNRFGKGNPCAKQASRLRKALYNAITVQDLREVVETLVAQAKAGDTAASKILLTALLGPPQSLDVLAIVAKLENVVFRGAQPS